MSAPDVPDDLPTALLSAARRRPPKLRLAEATLWLLVALPALYQLWLLTEAIAGRVGYPYDLEWMEGGMLHHAMRIREGNGIYVPPSIDFIPYLYTPLYPTLLALFGGPFGLSYTLGRVISILGLVGIAGVALVSLTSARCKNAALTCAGIALALGLFAAYYPYVEGWYDVVRADTFFLFMVTAGIAGLPRWATSHTGAPGHGKVAAGAALLALAFFCKQTGIFYVALGGAIVLVVNWRRAVSYAAMAGVIGLGGTAMLNRSTDGWFWTYIAEIHRAHDFNWDRFYASFGHILWHFPAVTIVIAATLLLVAATAIFRRALPGEARPFVLWTATFAVSTVVGAIGWSTEFAHFNAYMPAFLHGALAAGAALPAALGCVRQLRRDRARTEELAALAALVAALPLALTCALTRWEPARFVPTAADVAAGDRLIKRLAAIPGELWMPSHPWYGKLAGKLPHAHRMGIKDVTTRQNRVVEGLTDRLKQHTFAALVLDDRDLHQELPEVRQYYRPALALTNQERPRLRTGAMVAPAAIWVPVLDTRPPGGVRPVFDFEQPVWADGWDPDGPAWGTGPIAESLRGQDLVGGVTGRRFATSMTGGDTATGRLRSPAFVLDGSKLTISIGGASDSALRVELWVDDKPVRAAGVPALGAGQIPSEQLTTVAIDLAGLRGKHGALVLIDEAGTGHLNIDDVWLWP